MKIPGGTVHKLPKGLRDALMSNTAALTAWRSITPLARNEWICWVISVKQASTRENHVKRAIEELADGQRRPCCWMGCIHRTDKPLSPSVKAILQRK